MHLLSQFNVNDPTFAYKVTENQRPPAPQYLEWASLHALDLAAPDGAALPRMLSAASAPGTLAALANTARLLPTAAGTSLDGTA